MFDNFHFISKQLIWISIFSVTRETQEEEEKKILWQTIVFKSTIIMSLYCVLNINRIFFTRCFWNFFYAQGWKHLKKKFFVSSNDVCRISNKHFGVVVVIWIIWKYMNIKTVDNEQTRTGKMYHFFFYIFWNERQLGILSHLPFNLENGLSANLN